MVLEAVMICLDNSEWMRNGDYTPTRLDAQTEAVNYIADSRIKGNQESTVGVLSMAGHRIEVHSSPTRDIGKIMNSLGKSIQPYGTCNFIGGIKTAQLALKKRVNKRQQQRIIVFVGSPLENEVKELEKLGKQLKKNSVVVDIINFGVENETNGNPEKLEAFKNAVNGTAETSHLVCIPTGPHIVLLGSLLNTPIMSGASVYIPPAALGGDTSAPAGAKPFSQEVTDMDMAIRISLEHERKRIQEEQGQQGEEKKGAGGGGVPSETDIQILETGVQILEDGEDDEDEDEGDDEDEEAALLRAIQMSMESPEDPSEAPDGEVNEDESDVDPTLLDDRDFLADIMKDIDMDMDDTEVDDILSRIKEDADDTDKKEKDT